MRRSTKTIGSKKRVGHVFFVRKNRPKARGLIGETACWMPPKAELRICAYRPRNKGDWRLSFTSLRIYRAMSYSLMSSQKELEITGANRRLACKAPSMLAFRETEEPFVQTRRKRGVMSKEGERIGVSPYGSREVRRLHSAHLMSISLDATRTKDLKKPIVIRKNTYFQEGLVRWFYLVGARLPYTYG